MGVAIGVISATRPHGPADLTLPGVTYLGFATPTFLVGVLLQLGAVWLRDNGWAIMPVRGGHDPACWSGSRGSARRRRRDASSCSSPGRS